MVAVEHPEKNPPNTVFISYAREDREWAAEKARTFRGIRQDYFLDYESIRAGVNWRETLEQAVEAADLVWLIWSKYAAQSDWVLQEYLAALKKGKGGLRIDLLDSTPLPEELHEIQAERSPLAPPSYIVGLLKEPTRALPEGDLPPSVLLRAEYGVVPFIGRQDLLEDYEHWCEEETPLAVRLLTGGGGLGKTRFAIELCKHLRQKYWETAFVDRIEFERYINQGPEAANNLMRLRRPTLLVVDYAETRRKQVQELFQAALNEDLKQPVRILLLARSEGEWWQQLLRESHDYRILVGNASKPYQLMPVASGVEEREQIFLEATSAFSIYSENSWPSFLPSLCNKEFERVLFIHLAALAALDGKWIEEEEELLDFGVDRERNYWLKKGLDLQLTAELANVDVLSEGAAMLVLAGGCERQRLHEILKWQPDLSELSRLQLRYFSRVYSELYGVEERIEPLQPDLLGEKLVETVFRRNSELRMAWVKSSSSAELTNGLTVLNRIAARKTETEIWLNEVFEEDLERAALTAVTVAQTVGDPIGRLLANHLRLNPNPELSVSLIELLPLKTVALRELAETVTSSFLSRSKIRGEARAWFLYNQSIRLRDLNCREEALQLAGEAVDILRQANKAETFFPNLAEGLNSLSISLSGLGREEEASQVIEESIEIYRQLVQEQPETFLADLAMGLNNLGTMLGNLGQRERALELVEESIDICRQSIRNQSDVIFPILAMCLNNYGLRLLDLEQREKSLVAAEEAVEIYRQLVQNRPDAFFPELAGSLNNFGMILRESRQFDKALYTCREAADIYRQLVQNRPDIFLSEFASVLMNIGTLNSDLGRKEEALRLTEEAIDIYRQLERNQPDIYLPDLSMCLSNFGSKLLDLGRSEEAVTVTKEAIKNYLQILQERPAAFLPDLARSISNLGIIYGDLGRKEEALKVVKEAVDIYYQIVDIEPESFLPALARNLNILGTRYRDLEQFDNAIYATEEAIKIYQKLIHTQPSAFFPDLSLCVNNLGMNLNSLGEDEKALSLVEEAIRTLLPFFERCPQSYESHMQVMVGNYIDYLEKANRQPESQLVLQVAAIFDKLQPNPSDLGSQIKG